MANYGIILPYESLKEYLGIPAAQTSDDKLLFKFAVQASDKFNAHCHNRYFYPIKQTRYYDYPCNVYAGGVSAYQNSGQGFGFSTIPTPTLTYLDNARLELDEDLLEVITLTTQNGNQTITSSDYYLMTGDKYNFPPYDGIQLKSDGTVTAFSYSGSTQKSNAVTGYWGYHEHWAGAWQDSLDTVENNPLTSGGTSITVNDVDGLDLFGFTPRFQYQQLLKIEDEFLFVTGKNTTTNTLTVIRGVNGTTAAAHVQNTPIYIYQPMAEIVGAMQVLATYCYRRRENVGSQGDSGISANGILVIPSTLPKDVTDMLDIYKRWTKT